jgi:aryl-alcohol dehydrogenase-like predicted oxidoreductase
MNRRKIGRLNREVSEVGFGAWQIGGDWGDVDEDAALATLHAAADAGVTFFDTADVYGDGRSERLVGRLLRERAGEDLFVATKMGRRAEQTVANYSPEHFRAWNDRSRENLGMDTLDLVQLHCPPTDLYYRPEVFEDLERMVDEGRIAAYGVSVERVEEALKAIEYPGVASVQIIFNAFRQRPADRFLAEAARRGVGVIVRVPLASGLLSGKLFR